MKDFIGWGKSCYNREYNTPVIPSFPTQIFNDLDYKMDKEVHHEIKITFQLWYTKMIQTTGELFRIPHNLVYMYDYYILFESIFHNVFIITHEIVEVLLFLITKEEIHNVVT